MLDAGVDREALRAQLSEAGVQTSVHYPPVHDFSTFANGASPQLPATETYADRVVTLPMFPHMTAEQRGIVVEAIAVALGKG